MEYVRNHLSRKGHLLSESLGYITVSYFNLFFSRTGVGEFIPAIGIGQVSPNPRHFLGNIKVAIFFGYNLEQKKTMTVLHQLFYPSFHTYVVITSKNQSYR